MRWTPARAQIDGFVSWISEGRLNGRDRLLSGVDGLIKTKRGHEVEARITSAARSATRELDERVRPQGRAHGRDDGLRVRVLRSRLDARRGRHAERPAARATPCAWFFVGRVTAGPARRVEDEGVGIPGSATGDADPTDGKFQRFDPVYWGGTTSRRARRRNRLEPARPVRRLHDDAGEGWTLQAEAHVFRLDQSRDVWVDDAGTTLRRSAAGTAGNTLGRELDATLRWDTRGKVARARGRPRF